MSSETADADRRVVAGRYELGALLGEGGASRVHAATDLVSGAKVAVKLLDPAGKGVTPRVRREISALRLLRLPGVVSLLDEGVHDGAPFLVMDVVQGRPFPGAATPARWETIAPQSMALLEVLARVHAAGVVHRDLKPSNVLVDGDGRVTIVDFGISWGPALGEHLTTTGSVVGTPEFLAPEQFLGRSGDARADLYAVGEMLYACLTGRLPHQATDFMDLVERKRSRQPTPVRRLAAEVPREVAQAIDDLLAIDPDDRPQSAGEALSALFGRSGPLRPGPSIPRLGGAGALDRLVAAARAGRSMDVAGLRGSGRSRLLADVAERLAAEGRVALWAVPGSSPYSSLVPVLGGYDDLRRADRAHAEATIRARLASILRSGAVVLADDADRLDRWSLAALEASRDAGSVIRVTQTPQGERVDLHELSEADLRELFVGPDRILHLREDAARELALRTGGLPGRIVVEVAAWVRAGLAHWEGERVAVRRDALDRLRSGLTVSDQLRACASSGTTRSAQLDELLSWIVLAWPNSTVDVLAAVASIPRWTLEPELDLLAEQGMVRRLADGRILPILFPAALNSWPPESRRDADRALARTLPPGTPQRLRHLAAAGDWAEAADEALVLAPQLDRQGRGADALVVLEEGLAAARAAADAGREARVLAELTKTCIGVGTVASLDRALYEVTRAAATWERCGHVDALLRAAREAIAGDPAAALERLAAMEPFEDLDLELWRHAMRIRAVRRIPSQSWTPILEEIETWAQRTGHPRALASIASWKALEMLANGAHAEAARLQLEAASRSDRIAAQIGSSLNAAAAFLDAGLYADSAAAAQEAHERAALCRNARYEAHATFFLRQIAHRSGAAREPDVEFAEIAEAVEPEIAGGVFLIEAAIAWRCGASSQARELAARAVRALGLGASARYRPLARALELAAGSSAHPGEAEALASESALCGDPEIAVETLGLLSTAFPERCVAWREAAARRALELPHRGLDRGLVLSLDEALGRSQLTSREAPA